MHVGALPDRFSLNILSREERCVRSIFFSQLAKGSLFLAVDDGVVFCFFFPSVFVCFFVF